MDPMELSTIAGSMELSRAPMDSEVLRQVVAQKCARLHELRQQQARIHILMT